MFSSSFFWMKSKMRSDEKAVHQTQGGDNREGVRLTRFHYMLSYTPQEVDVLYWNTNY